MKRLGRTIERHLPWLLLLLGLDCLCAVILWISDIRAFTTLIGLIFAASVLLFAASLLTMQLSTLSRISLLPPSTMILTLPLP